MKENISVTVYLKSNKELKKINSDIVYDESNFIASMDLNIPNDITQMFIEFESISIFKNLEIVSDNGIIDYKNLNGINLKKIDIFLTETPKIDINFGKQKVNYIKIKMEMYRFSREYISLLAEFVEVAKLFNSAEERYTIIEKELNDLIQYKQEYLDVKSQKDELQRKVNELTEFIEYKQKYFDILKTKEEVENNLNSLKVQYDCISNSTCWKMTKPLRVCLDVLKRNKLIGLVFKVKNNLKTNGVKATYVKVKNKLKIDSEGFKNQNNILSEEEIENQKNTKFSQDIKFSVVVPISGENKEYLFDTINSILTQTYENFELYLTNYGDKTPKELEKDIIEISKQDERVIYRSFKGKIGVQESIENTFKIVTGDYIVLGNENDMFAQNALYEITKGICENQADFIYSDEDKFKNNLKNCFDPYFKPDYSPDTLNTHNYIANLIAFDKKLLKQIEKSKIKYKTAFDYDLTFKLTEKAKHILHIPKILYHLRSDDEKSEYVFPKQYDSKEAKDIIKNHLERINKKAEIVDTNYPNIYRVNYKLLSEPLVSIIILNKDKISYLKRCIDSIITKTTYKNYEIIIVENNSVETKTFEYYDSLKTNPKIKIITYDKSPVFNFSEINNYAVEKCSGEMLLLLNNDTEVITPNWIEEMLGQVQYKDVGIVGVKLFFPSGALQHVGVCVGLYGIAAHYFQGVEGNFNGYFGRLHSVQNLGAVTGACVMLRREVFEEVRGFDEGLAVAYNDIDLCLKIWKAGYSVVWTPYVELYHHESITRGYASLSEEKMKQDKAEGVRFVESWKHLIQKGDPYYNVNLPRNRSDFKFSN